MSGRFRGTWDIQCLLNLWNGDVWPSKNCVRFFLSRHHDTARRFLSKYLFQYLSAVENDMWIYDGNGGTFDLSKLESYWNVKLYDNFADNDYYSIQNFIGVQVAVRLEYHGWEVYHIMTYPEMFRTYYMFLESTIFLWYLITQHGSRKSLQTLFMNYISLI